MFQWLSTFLMNPALAVGAGAVASPILIHILSRRRFRRVKWAAMEFLLEAQRRNRRRVRVEQLILLLLRCAAVLLIAMLLMRPFLRPGAVAAILGASARTERIVLLDDSFSTEYRPKSASQGALKNVLQRGCDAVLELARLAGEESTGDSLTLLLTSAPNEPAAALSSLSDDRLAELKQTLSMLEPSHLPANMPDAIAAAAKLIERSPQANTALYVISDFQRRDWLQSSEHRSGEEKPRSLLAPLAAAARGRESLKTVLLNVGEPPAENAAVVDIASTRSQSIAGIPSRFEVSVANYSMKPMSQVELGVSISEHRLAPITIERIEPGQTAATPIEVTFPREGADFIRVELMAAERFGDSVRLDNVRAAAVDVVSAIAVLIVNGEPSRDSFRDEVYLLKTALRPAGRAASGIDVTVVEELDLESSELDARHVIILANVNRLNPQATASIDRFVRAGGGLIVFAGDLLDLDYYNREFYRDGAGFLPASLAEFVEVPGSVESITFSEPNGDHPLVRPFFGSIVELLRQVKIFDYVKVTINEAATSTLSTRPGDDGVIGVEPESAAARVRVALRLSDAGHSPAIVERRVGRGRSIFIATSADQEWNDWASNFSYLPMILETVQYCARSSANESSIVAGRPILHQFDAAQLEGRALLRTPGYPIEPEIPLKATSGPDAASEFQYRDAMSAGMYALQLRSTTGESVKRFVAVNPDSTESNLASAAPAELDAALAQDIAYEYIANASSLTNRTDGARRELWWPLLMMAVVVLMCEQSLAWWFGKRG